MQAARTKALVDLTGRIYEAAFDPQAWREVVAALCRHFDGSRACIVRLDANGADFIASVADPEIRQPTAWSALRDDPLSAASGRVPVGRVYHRRDIIDEARFRRRPLFAEWFAPRDMHDGLASNLHCGNGTHWSVDVQRSGRQQPFGADEAAALDLLVPHLIRAGELTRSVSTPLFASTFGRLPHGALLVDAAMRVRLSNDAADCLLARASGPLTSRGRLLGAVNDEEQKALAALVARCCETGSDDAPDPGRMLILGGGGNQARVMASVAPYPLTHMHGMVAEACAIVLLKDLSAATPELGNALRALYRLAPAEIRLALALGEGRSLRLAAAAQGITDGTARSYLEQIFRKTGTHRQAELVALIKSVANAL